MSDIDTEIRERMKKSMQSLEIEFNGIRTGRANVAMFERIKVEVYGQTLPLNQTATISIPEARLVLIQPWDTSNLKDIEKSIQQSDLALNPVNDGKVIRISIPPLTEERRREIAKVARNTAEQVRVALRNIRRDLNEKVKQKVKTGLGEDDAKREEEKIQRITNESIEKVNSILATKEQEIMEI